MFFKRGVLKYVTKLKKKHKCRSLFLIQLLEQSFLIKSFLFLEKRLRHSCFPVTFAKFSRAQGTIKQAKNDLLIKQLYGLLQIKQY